MNEHLVKSNKQRPVNNEMGDWLAALRRYCLAITTSRWDAEDLIQETCLKALPVLTGLQQHANPKAFLMRTAKNLSIDHVRRNQTALKQADNRNRLFQLHEDSFDLEHVVGLLVAHLTPLQCSVFLLRDFYGFKASEVADALDTSEGAVKAVLHRARMALDAIRDGIYTLQTESEQSESEEQIGLLHAYTLAISQSNPEALVLLALAQNENMDSVQATSRVIQLTARRTKRVIQASQSNLLRCAA